MARRQYAKGRNAVAECQRSGQKMMYRDLIEDGHIPGLLVHPDWWEPKHPQEIPVRVDDPVALYRPSPEISVEPDYGNPDVNYGETPTAPVIIDTFDRANGDPGAVWENSGLNILFPSYFQRPQISSNALIPTPATFSFYAVSHTDTLPVDHYVEATLRDVFTGAYFIGQYVWARATVGTNADVDRSVDSGYYCYLTASTVYGQASLALSRWDINDSPGGGGFYLQSQQVPIPGAGVIPNGTVLGMRCVNNDILGYLRLPDGSEYSTAGATIIGSNPASASEGEIGRAFSGMNNFNTQQRVGIGLEGYGGGSIGVDRFEAGGINTYQGTLIDTLTGGETRLRLNDAMRLGPFAEWIGIELDGGGWHMTRLTTGYASASDSSPVFDVEFNTPFPTGATATAGNSYYIGGQR